MEKDIVAHIRFNRDDYGKIKAKAKELGLSVSAYIRMMLLKN